MLQKLFFQRKVQDSAQPEPVFEFRFSGTSNFYNEKMENLNENAPTPCTFARFELQ